MTLRQCCIVACWIGFSVLIVAYMAKGGEDRDWVRRFRDTEGQ